MGRLLKYLTVLVALAVVVVAVYALLFDLPSPYRDISQPVDLSEDQ